MLGQIETTFGGDFMLALFDGVVVEFFDFAAFKANEVVVVAAVVEFEYRMTTFEVMTQHQTGLFELRQNSVHGGESNVVILLQKGLVHVFRTHMPVRCVFENVQNFGPGQGDF